VKGDAGALHDRPIEPVARIEVLEIERPAVVLGSTQSFDVVDAARAAESGFDVVRRRSGGGVVILQPSDHAWIDVTIPRGHSLWHDDVERATWWLGDVWCNVLQDVVSASPSSGGSPSGWVVHREKLVATAPERAVCFASIGPGEVVRGNRKVVGISQRRTKDAARFQCTVFREVNSSLYERLLRIEVPASLGEAVGVGEKLDDVSRVVVERLTEAIGSLR
jgi:lipoate-protein ligase A